MSSKSKAILDVLRDIQCIIDELGWCVVREPQGDTFISYTIGLASQNLPELIVYGLEADAGRHLLNTVAEAVVSEGFVLAHREVDTTLLARNRLTFLSLDEKQASAARMLVSWSNHTDTPIAGMFQVVWSDANGLFPWQDQELLSIQPVALNLNS